jgi:hypothetical protein
MSDQDKAIVKGQKRKKENLPNLKSRLNFGASDG